MCGAKSCCRDDAERADPAQSGSAQSCRRGVVRLPRFASGSGGRARCALVSRGARLPAGHRCRRRARLAARRGRYPRSAVGSDLVGTRGGRARQAHASDSGPRGPRRTAGAFDCRDRDGISIHLWRCGNRCGARRCCRRGVGACCLRCRKHGLAWRSPRAFGRARGPSICSCENTPCSSRAAGLWVWSAVCSIFSRFIDHRAHRGRQRKATPERPPVHSGSRLWILKCSVSSVSSVVNAAGRRQQYG